MATNKSNNVFSTQNPSGMIFVGSIVIGVAVGMFEHNTGAYTLLGLGVGFILAAIFSASSRNKS